MKRATPYRIVYTALFAALICSATALLRVPSPIGGYLNLGDGPVLLAGFLLGPAWGAAAAGLGSMLADLLAGYPMYAAGTLVIKALAALAGGGIFRRLRGRGVLPAAVAAGACGALVVAMGYFCFEATCLGYGMGAAVEVPANLCQGGAGAIVAAFLAPRLLNNPRVDEQLKEHFGR